MHYLISHSVQDMCDTMHKLARKFPKLDNLQQNAHLWIVIQHDIYYVNKTCRTVCNIAYITPYYCMLHNMQVQFMKFWLEYYSTIYMATLDAIVCELIPISVNS